MNEQRLQALSKALTHLVFRNGVVENLHADGVCLDDVTMKKLNINVHNRIFWQDIMVKVGIRQNGLIY